VAHAHVDAQEKKEHDHAHLVGDALLLEHRAQLLQGLDDVRKLCIVLTHVVEHLEDEHRDKGVVLGVDDVEHDVVHVQRLQLRGAWHACTRTCLSVLSRAFVFLAR
jgi:hypothetical protein